MAIAPLPFIGGPETEDVPWPRPTLTLVKTLERTREHVEEQSSETVVELFTAPERAEPIRVGADVAERRRVRAAKKFVRRRIAVATLALATIVVLALPLATLGTVTVSGQATPGGSPAGLVDGSVYVAQPGDTLASIAQRINPARATQLVAQMRNQVGSSTIVAGEHLVLP
jgi:hypothetical protein